MNFCATPVASLGLGLGGGPWIALFVVLAIAAPWIAWRSYARTEPALSDGRRRMHVVLRTVILWGLLAMLAEPVLHRETAIETVPGVALVVDDSASMSIADAEGRSRLEVALALRDRLAAQLAGDSDERRIWLESGARRVVESVVLDEAAPRPVDAVREGTDLPGLALSSSQRHLEDNLAAIVLFTDGRSTTPTPPRIDALDVPVSVVLVGDSLRTADLRLDRVRYPSLVSQGDRVEITAELVADARAEGEAEVRLRRGETVVDSLRVSWPRDGGRRPLRFVVDADSLGPARFTLEVRPAPQEALLSNNAVEVGFLVGKDRLRVFHVQQKPNWDLHFMRRAAREDPRIEWTAAIAGSDGLRIAGTDSLVQWPLPPEDSAEIDVWIAGSFEDLEFLLGDGSPVRDQVRRGASLLALVGADDPRVRPGPLAKSLLPLQPSARTRRALADLRPRLTPQGRAHPAMALDPQRGDPGDRFAAFPPLRSALTGLDLAVDADVLLEGVAARASVPLLAVREVEQGRVAVLNGAPFWSWSFWRLTEENTEDTYREWILQLIAYLAEGGDRERLQLNLPRPVLAQGEDVLLRAVILDERSRGDASTDVWLEWTRDDTGDEAVLGRARMRPDPSTPGGRQLPMPALPAGHYRVRARAETPRGEWVSAWQNLTIDSYSVEYRNPAVDAASARDFARRTGGGLLDPLEFAAWVDRLESEPDRRVLVGRFDLGASLWLLLPWLALLSLEWVLRKRAGLL